MSTDRVAADKPTRPQPDAVSNDFSKMLLEKLPVGVVLCRTDGTLIEVNLAFADLIGRPKEELLGLTYADLTPTRYAQEDARHIEQIGTSGRYGPYEKEFVHKDGHLVPVRLTGRIVERDGERLIWSAVENIADRKRAEARGAEQVETLRAMDAINRAIVATDDPDRVMSRVLEELLAIFDCDRANLLYPCNPNAETCRARIGISRPDRPDTEAAGTKFPVTPTMAARMARLLESPTPVLSGPGHEPLEPDMVKSYSLAAVMSIAIHPKLGEPWILAIQHSKQDHVWTEAESRLLQVIAGRIGDSLTSLLSLRDLRESEARLRTVVEHAPEAIVVFDAERQLFVDANANALQLFALTRDALCKLGPSDLSPPTQPDGTDSNEAARRYIQHAVDGEIPSFEWTHRNAEGRDIPCEVRLVRLPAGDRVLLRGSLSDISERKRSEQELAHYRNHLEELVEQRTNELERSRQNLLTSERLASLGTLAAGIAHQINNPLGSILNGAEFALLSEDDPERKQIWKRALEDNVEQALRCGQIVKSVLLFSRGETIEKHVGDVVALVRRTCELSDRYAEDAEAVVELSAPAEPIHVLMSEIEIEQVLVNLIHNAVESRDSGARVEVRVVLDGDAVRIEVADDGRGIPVDVQSKIFDPFFTTRLKAGGTGLGLSVAHGILADHGGSIDVQSQPGRGTTVWVTLHRADPNA